MNIVTEANISGKPIEKKAHTRPIRPVRWFIIVGSLLALLVGALVGFNAFRSHMIAQFFANNKPPPSNVDRKSTRLNSSHTVISYAVFCLKKKKQEDLHCSKDSLL